MLFFFHHKILAIGNKNFEKFWNLTGTKFQEILIMLKKLLNPHPYKETFL